MIPRMSKPIKPGKFRRAGVIIENWLDAHPAWDREKLADEVGVSVQAIGHWITGKSWPRDPGVRATLARLHMDVVSIDRIVCEVLRLEPNTADERAILDAYRIGGKAIREKFTALVERVRNQ